MASVSELARGGLRLPGVPPRFLALVLGPPALLGLSYLAPEEGAGLGLRIAAAAACVLFLPGVLVLRAVHWPDRLGLVLAGSLAWSLGVVFVAMVLTFAANGSLALTVALLAVLSAGALVPALGAPPGRVLRADALALAWVAGAGILLCGLVWWSSTQLEGDGLFHLARARKLAELPSLPTVGVVNEFRDGSLHAGYAAPLWHDALALVSRLAGVDVSLVVLHLSALLVPVALVLAYAAGEALFASWGGGVAAAAGQAALVAFPRNGTGSFEVTALPASASRLLLVPALLALVFSFLRGGARAQLSTIAVCGFAIAVVHPTYAVFVALPLAAFLLARLLLAEEGRGDWRRLAAALAAVLVPTGLFFAWLWPAVSGTESFRPDAGERARGVAQYAGQLDVIGDSFRLSPEAIARGGAATVVALLAIPAAVLAPRRRFAAFVLGAGAAVLGVLLLPPLFTALADASSLSQARRLVLFLPLPFALAGAALLAARLGPLGGLGALGLGVGAHLAWGGHSASGPAFAAWVALGGAVLALVSGRVAAVWLGPRLHRAAALGARLRAWPPPYAGRVGEPALAAACALSLVLPVAVAGLADVERDRPDRRALTAGLVESLRTLVPPRATVFADLEASYRIAAAAPVSIAAAPPAHVAGTAENRPFARRADVIRFFYRDAVSAFEKAAILREYGATWLVVDRTRKVPAYVDFLPPPVYADEHFALYRLRSPG